MDLGIHGRVAIVTGGSTGIGLAIARELAANDVSVVIVACDERRLADAKALLSSEKARVLSIVSDVAKPESAQFIVNRAIEEFGQIDILVDNAGRALTGGLMSSSEQEWADMTDLKLSAVRRMCGAAVPGMRERDWGRIVNMSSIGGIHPNPKLFVSHVLSAAINNLTKSLALEVAGDGILVNAIAVGAVATDNWSRNMTPAIRQLRPELSHLSDHEVLARISAQYTPIGRAGYPREIAAIAAFLASDRNGFVTGATIEASGGADRFM
jgi:3-oxoacyl-[acyl-carrier protein] reductase